MKMPKEPEVKKEATENKESEVSNTENKEVAKPLYVGKKEIKSQEELLAYVAELEKGPALPAEKEVVSAKQIFDSEDEEEAPAPVITGGKKPASEPNLTEDQSILAQLIADPKKTIEEISEKVVAKIDETAQTKKQVQKVWEDFYKANPELAAHKELVEMKKEQLARKYAQAEKVPPLSEAFAELATEAKRIVKHIRDTDEEVEEVDTSKKNIGMSSTGNPAPKTVTTQPKVSNFTSAIRNFQESKRKSS
jgi:uncharacterized coiled-coil protein SlyX